MIFLAHGVRASGGACTIHEPGNAVLKCSLCGCRIFPGTRFSRVPEARSGPACKDCEPFSVQVDVFGAALEPKRGRATPPTHRLIREYVGGDGIRRRRRDCLDCRTTGRVPERILIQGGAVGRSVHVRRKCESCSGSGYLWEKMGTARPG